MVWFVEWEQFFAYVIDQMKNHQPVDEKVFDNRIKEWEWNWVNSHEPYPDKPKGDAVVTAKEMYKKYWNLVERS